ncbi:LysR family transcriptional regulator [Sphingomonas sp. TX0543]|uniref:LysR family transcriptional regulator n=1 Tax=Sphingomonas sp. TX0543 TaxID=3399682 RepID=UPI003AFB0411
MDQRTTELQVFVRVAESGSFSEAARVLRKTPSTISKLVSRMETRLGVRLFERSTRRLALTLEGTELHERGRNLLAELDAVERDIGAGGSTARGTVRVNASVAFGRLVLLPILPVFWDAHPEITLDLSFTDEVVDLYLDRTDVAFRVGGLVDSSLVGQRLGAARRLIVASPDYIARHGEPMSANDLLRHNCLGFNFRRAAPVWPMREGSRIVDRKVAGSLLANEGEIVRSMCFAGVGLARLADFHVRDDVGAGRLVEVLSDAVPHDEEEIGVLHTGGARPPRRVSAFLDFVIPRLRRKLGG